MFSKLRSWYFGKFQNQLFSQLGLLILLQTAICILGGLHVYQQLNRIASLRQSFNDADSNLEKLIIHSHQFFRFAPKDPAFHQSGTNSEFEGFRQNVQSFQTSLKSLQSEAPAQAEKIATVLSILEECSQNFTVIASLYKETGYKDWGLEGKWRQAIHQIEKSIDEKKFPLLMISYLKIRRLEKDFILRSENESADAVSTEFKKLRDFLQKNQPSQLANADLYQRSFELYRSRIIKAGKANAAFFNGIEKIETTYDDLLETLEREWKNKLHLTLIYTSSFGFGILLIGLFVLQKISYRIASPVQKMETFVKEISKGNLDTSIDLGRKDEFLTLEKELNFMTRKLRTQITESRLVSLGQMSAGIGHEIMNPLAIIDGKAKSLARGLGQSADPGKDTHIQKVEAILKNSERIAAIIKGLKTMARNGDADPFIGTELQSIINESFALCQFACKRHNIDLKTDVIPLVKLDCRAVQIQQVLVNLINNAKDALDPLPEKWIRIESRLLGDQIEIRIVDSGKGIPPEIATKLMEPFFTTKPVGKGTGLGLSISRQIIESHNGKFFLDTQAPNTTFVIVLPQTQAAPVPLAA